ncbi:hypothetical protein pdam_00008744 [Pocillopora damicornis]|uniref:Uncharacterized protein n=1 Tax=Pocillopora damicornis TaxID=46731 RepID=A0A3M6UA59_POCDA|nr:hypothetical protein pdam_00008744 [Pocillopora damicornis]
MPQPQSSLCQYFHAYLSGIPDLPWSHLDEHLAENSLPTTNNKTILALTVFPWQLMFSKTNKSISSRPSMLDYDGFQYVLRDIRDSPGYQAGYGVDKKLEDHHKSESGSNHIPLDKFAHLRYANFNNVANNLLSNHNDRDLDAELQEATLFTTSVLSCRDGHKIDAGSKASCQYTSTLLDNTVWVATENGEGCCSEHHHTDDCSYHQTYHESNHAENCGIATILLHLRGSIHNLPSPWIWLERIPFFFCQALNILWTKWFLFFFKVRGVPFGCQRSLPTFPKLKKERGPNGCSKRQNNCSIVIKDIRDVSVKTGRWSQIPVTALPIAQWTHVPNTVVPFITYVLYRGVGACCYYAVQEHDQSNDCEWNQHRGVKSKPGEVQANFVTKVILNGIVGLVLETSAQSSPISLQALPIIDWKIPIA